MAELEKVLNFKMLLLITINSILGTGIFFLPAIGVKIAGPASIISWVILSGIAIYISTCFAELASMFPKAGGIYEFCKQAYGRRVSFIVGWMTIIAGNITIAMLVVGAIHYLLPFHLPFIKTGLSLFFIFLFNFIAYRGMRTSATMLIAFAFITLITLVALIIPGFLSFNTANFIPFFPFSTSVIFLAIFFIAETFFGWETATFLAGETKDGQKVMPKALVTATVVIAIISLLFIVSSIGSMPWQEFGQSTAPLFDLSRVHYGVLGSDLFVILVYVAIIGSVAGWIVSAPRLYLAMAEDKLLPYPLAKIHKKFKTPSTAIIFQTVLTSIIVIMGAGSYNVLIELLVPIVLIVYSATVLSVTVLRFKQPNTKRYFRAPFAKVGPAILIVFNVFLIVMWLNESSSAVNMFLLGLSLIAAGIPVYLLLEAYYDPKMIENIDNLFARVTLASENIALPIWVRRKIFSLLGDIDGKRVFEIGCSVGTLTLGLAKKTKRGVLYCSDLAIKHVEMTKKRLAKKNHTHVKVLHHHYADSIHPDIKKFDVMVGVDITNYVLDLKKMLRVINRRLVKGGQICIVDYDMFFHIIPNDKWIHHRKHLVERFAEQGFDVKLFTRQGLLWKYVFIVGKKVRNV